ncbi:hypothetical protein [Planktothrix pseudagardhii]|uniref:Uncharacterized protein n=1 Tax=Planktothrix pseudagardhii TaxID=132604 RepID=A0A9W4CFS4_9CYAN|nr:hypothetical protein [Planktothrix pseudagardhii]CAD5924873.1 hypothetical protein NO713_00904 [Planktothrix pseudagardhii]
MIRYNNFQVFSSTSARELFSVSWSPDSQTIASGSYDNTIKLWHLDLDQLMVSACEWMKDYLENSSSVSEEDRCLCEGVRVNQQP